MTFDTHYILLGAGLLGIENVANLTSIMGAEATVVCAFHATKRARAVRRGFWR